MDTAGSNSTAVSTSIGTGTWGGANGTHSFISSVSGLSPLAGDLVLSAVVANFGGRGVSDASYVLKGIAGACGNQASDANFLLKGSCDIGAVKATGTAYRMEPNFNGLLVIRATTTTSTTPPGGPSRGDCTNESTWE